MNEWMKLSFISFLVWLGWLFVDSLSLLSFFLWLRERRKARLIDWLMEEASCWSLMNFYYFSLFNWLINRNQFYFFFTFEWINEWIKSTDDNGYLGSCIDEERSKVRKAMWIAQHVNHQIFERIWRLGSCFQACLFESRFHNCKLFLLFFLSFIHFCDWLIDLEERIVCGLFHLISLID